MKNLPEVNLSVDPLTRILYGAIPTKLLLTGIELKVFSHLTEPKSADSWKATKSPRSASSFCLHW